MTRLTVLVSIAQVACSLHVQLRVAQDNCTGVLCGQTKSLLSSPSAALESHNESISSGPLADKLHIWTEDVFKSYNDMGCRIISQEKDHISRPICSHTLLSNQINSSAFLTEIPTFYISLTDANSKKWLQDYGRLSKNIKVVHGVLGTDRAAVESHVTEKYAAFQQIAPGVLGCTLSHLRAIQSAYETGSDVALILESDARPHLAPWWTQSVDEFARSLPDGWEGAQLQWLSQPRYGEPKLKYNVNATSTKQYIKFASWGTGAYLIHRRGMRRILSKLWNDKLQKFHVAEFRNDCSDFTADGCLLSFKPTSVLRPSMLTSIYRAVPPMFTSSWHESSVQSRDQLWMKKSLCDDIKSTVHFEKMCWRRLLR